MKNKLLSRWFGQSTKSTTPSKVLLRDGLSILIVDDSRKGILMAKKVLPDLILMDIVMPEINGFQATRYLSRQAETGHIPIIIVSGTDQGSDKAWGLKLGAKDYIQKPVQKDLLLAKISRWTAEVGVEKPQPPASTPEKQDSTWVEAG